MPDPIIFKNTIQEFRQKLIELKTVNSKDRAFELEEEAHLVSNLIVNPRSSLYTRDQNELDRVLQLVIERAREIQDRL